MNRRLPIVFVLALGGLGGCEREPMPLPTCEVEPYVSTLVGFDARDCGSWELGSGQASDAVDCVLDSIDAGIAFHYRVNGLARPNFEQAPFEPYLLANYFVGLRDQRLMNVFFDSSLGGRIELFRCDGFEVDKYTARDGGIHRQLDCNSVGNERICSFQRQHKEAQLR